MKPLLKKTSEAKRVICRCRAFDCHQGRFVDAYGVSQNGVEVLPSTRDAHLRVELRKKALAKDSSVVSSTSTTNPTPSNHVDTERDLLSDQIEYLNLRSSPAPQTTRSSQIRPNNLTTQSGSRVFQNHESTETSASSTQSQPSVLELRDERHDSSKTCLAASNAREKGLSTYDCSPFHATNFEELNPVLLHIVLTVGILSVFGHLSSGTASWLFDCLRILIELSMSHGLDIVRSSVPIFGTDTLVLQRIPRSISTAIRWLSIDPYLIDMNCCQACFALYPIQRTPNRCTHQICSIPGGPTYEEDPDTDLNPIAIDQKPNTFDFEEETCGHQLLRYARGKEIPVRRYAFQRLSDWIARLLSRPGVEDWLDDSLKESCRPFDPKQNISDIHQSKVWKQFRGPDDKQYTATSGNLTFAMFVDAINPFGNKTSGKHASITFIVMVCLTLPIHLRHQPENIFIVGIAPGPREPSLEQTNWILKPIVTELQVLWKDGLLLSKTHQYRDGRLVHAALLIFIADVPALRRTLGFPSATALNFCSICHLTKKEIENLDSASWPIRKWAQHRIWAYQARDSKTVKERKEIFETHGVRYSILNELEYWDIIEYHVIDSMHNLLLGLLSWHTRRFWSMKDVKGEEETFPPISKAELLDLFLEHSQPPPRNLSNLFNSTAEEEPKEGINAEESLFEANTSGRSSTDDDDYDPLGEAGWKGVWSPPPIDDIVFDATMLSYVNSVLPRIHIPRWIKRAIRVLGKASFGKLKADEWRNLFSIQLPLVLIPVWYGRDPVKTSLLKNFLHLVSLVNLALKRKIKQEQIDKYRHHIRQYLESSLKLFEHCNLAPNHHLAIHLADSLEKFGPVRSWWSFPFERFMGSILKGCHNNHVGELEITFLRNTCRAGNLASLLRDNKLPNPLRPYAKRLQSLYEPEEPAKKTFSNSDLQPLDQDILEMLMYRLNNLQDHSHRWLTPEKLCILSEEEASQFLPIQARAVFHKRLDHEGVHYTTFSESSEDSFIIFMKAGLKSFGRIFSMFTHRRSLDPSNTSILDTWLHVQCFPPIPASMKHLDPFEMARAPDVQTHLRSWGPTLDCLVRLDEVIAHCAWMMYKSGEIHDKLDIPTVALLSMER